MKNKIVGIFIGILLIATVIPLVGVANWTNTQKLLRVDDLVMNVVGYSVSIPNSKEKNSGSMYGILKEPTNQPPIFGTPTPANGSIGNPLSLNWTIPISDPEGDLFWWSIECDGQSFSADNQTNGTAGLYLSLSSYETTYKVWVNATDFMGNVTTYTRAWYTFTTEDYSLIFGTPTPANGSINTPLSFIWSIPINRTIGWWDFEWSIQCNNGQANSAWGASNGTKSLNLSGLLIGTIYKVWVNASYSNYSGPPKSRWYTFRTQEINTPPVFGIPTPANGSTNNPLSFTWIIMISDSQGDAFSWTIQCSNGQTNSKIGASNGIKSLDLSGLKPSITYKVWVNATDPAPPGSGQYTRRWYIFTTQGGNNPPVFFAPNPANSSSGNQQNLTWSIPINDSEGDLFSWTIECSNGQKNSKTNATNGTKSLDLLGLVNSTIYKVWVNATDPTPGSNQYTREWYTFKVGAERFDTNIKGGFGVSAVIRNNGNKMLTDLSWWIHISGGIILSNRQFSGTIPELAVNASKTIKSSGLWGIGSIVISVQVDDKNKNAIAFLLGPLVLGVKQQ
jgi:hypothetical protein